MTVEELERTTAPVDGEERDRQSHYVKKEDILTSMTTGVPAKALCGKEWVPTRDGEKYPLCKTCEKIFSKLPKGE